jgi:hypothetical protein
LRIFASEGSAAFNRSRDRLVVSCGEMSGDGSIACSLNAGDLERRLADVAEVGAEGLISREERDGLHLLRFRADARIRRRLEEIVVAESRCCAFLDLALDELDGETTLSIAAPPDAKSLADGLAAAFDASAA